MVAFFVLVSVYVVAIGFVSSAQNSCKTPNNLDGECIPLQQCQPLYNLLSPTIPNEQREFLRKSQCGVDGAYTPRVCCPLSQDTFTEADLPRPGACGTQAKDRIVGGEETSIQDYPWMALLHYKKPGGGREGFFCGGALIHRNYVITAAHCIRGQSLIRNRYSVDYIRFGEHDLRSQIDCQEGECADPVMNIQVAETIVHENYSPGSTTQANDIALIRLKQPTPFTDFIRPICLPTAANLRNRNFDDAPLVVAGFGRTENATRSDVKLKLEVNGFNLNHCSNVYKQAGYTLSNKQLCAGGEEGKDSCSGDSGGPLMGDDSSNALNPFAYLAGVVSFGPKICGTPGFPGVYTRVDQYIEWIVDKMKK